MPKVAALKKKALIFEQKKQFDKALLVYQQALSIRVPDNERDIQLYNRAGDLCRRQNKYESAIEYYEQAIDLYSATGMLSNAIALCNKVLRQDPQRDSIYLRLGRLSARKGFFADSKQNFIEYAARARTAGRVNDALSAIMEFVDLCPKQDDVRLMLADQLAMAGRPDEAFTQLQIVFNTMTREHRHMEAAATLDRIRLIDPDFTPSQSSDVNDSSSDRSGRDGLVIISIDD